jgi:hypothetical protein
MKRTLLALGVASVLGIAQASAQTQVWDFTASITGDDQVGVYAIPDPIVTNTPFTGELTGQVVLTGPRNDPALTYNIGGIAGSEPADGQLAWILAPGELTAVENSKGRIVGFDVEFSENSGNGAASYSLNVTPTSIQAMSFSGSSYGWETINEEGPGKWTKVQALELTLRLALLP